MLLQLLSRFLPGPGRPTAPVGTAARPTPLSRRGRLGLALVLLVSSSFASTPELGGAGRAATQTLERPGYVERAVYTGVRLTYYTDAGTMYSGLRTYEGAAAAHLNWLPIGTRFTLDCLPGHVYTVLDTGLMPPHWVDIFVYTPATGRWLTSVCGDWVTMRVVDPVSDSAPAPAPAPVTPAAPAAAPAPAALPTPVPLPAAPASPGGIEGTLAEALRAHIARRGIVDIPPFTVAVGARSGDWVRALLVPQGAGVQTAAAYLHRVSDGWEVVAGPGNAFDPDWLRALGVPPEIIAP